MCNLFFSVSDLTKNSILFFNSDQLVAMCKYVPSCSVPNSCFNVHVSSSEMCFKLIKAHIYLKRSIKVKSCIFLVLRKLLLVRFCVVVWVLFSVFSIFCITSLVSATPRNHHKSKKLHLLYPYPIPVQTLIPYFRWQWVKSMTNFWPKGLNHILWRLCGFKKEWHPWFISFLVLQTGELLEVERVSLQAGSYVEKTWLEIRVLTW